MREGTLRLVPLLAPRSGAWEGFTRPRDALPQRFASLLRLCTGLGISASAFAACGSP
jgi:hypothetical protein